MVCLFVQHQYVMLNVYADEAEFSMARKRTGSPSISPTKKSKKQKTGTIHQFIFVVFFEYHSPGSPITRVKTDPDIQSSPVVRDKHAVSVYMLTVLYSYFHLHIQVHKRRYPQSCASRPYFRHYPTRGALLPLARTPPRLLTRRLHRLYSLYRVLC